MATKLSSSRFDKSFSERIRQSIDSMRARLGKSLSLHIQPWQYCWAVYIWHASDDESPGCYRFSRYWDMSPGPYENAAIGCCAAPPGWSNAASLRKNEAVMWVSYPPPQDRVCIFNSEDEEFIERLTQAGYIN